MSSPKSSIAKVPPLVSLAMRPLPLLPLQPVLAFTLSRICARHPGLFDRLGIYAQKRFGISPTDLPFAFILEPRPRRASLVAVRQVPEQIDVHISGPIAGLVGLVGGDFDGDALFFSRDLRIEGDVEALLALRNAIDDAQIDLIGEVLGDFGLSNTPVERVLRSWLPQPAAQNEPVSRGELSWN